MVSSKFNKTIELFKKAGEDGVFPGGCLSIGDRSGEILRCCTGYKSLYPTREVLNEDTLFDMASLTKILSTTMVTLRFLEEGLLSLQDNLGFFFNNCTKDKEEITILNLMTHTSGLKGSIPLYTLVSNEKEAIDEILRSDLAIPPNTDTIYSCLGFILLGRILEIVGNNTLDKLSEEYVFNPLEMYNTGFNPRNFNIASTEYSEDIQEYLKGIVHDENARFLKGISGNAGVFSNLNDMNKFAQMLSNEGGYKGKQFLGENTFNNSIYNFTKGKSEHRGLGFSLKDNRIHPAGDLFSLGSYGHTGFTGTSLWIDKETGMYTVLLTNRVHPTRDNIRLIRFRRLLHNAVITEYKGGY